MKSKLAVILILLLAVLLTMGLAPSGPPNQVFVSFVSTPPVSGLTPMEDSDLVFTSPLTFRSYIFSSPLPRPVLRGIGDW
jgi:hypothetical protein